MKREAEKDMMVEMNTTRWRGGNFEDILEVTSGKFLRYVGQTRTIRLKDVRIKHTGKFLDVIWFLRNNIV